MGSGADRASGSCRSPPNRCSSVRPATPFLGGRVFEEGRLEFKAESSGPIRIASVGAFYPDLGAVAEGLEKTNVNDGFQIQHAADLYERLYPILEPAYLRGASEQPMDAAVDDYQGTNAQAVMDLMSVRYLVSDRPGPARAAIESIEEDEEPVRVGVDALEEQHGNAAEVPMSSRGRS